ncbi:caspase family protein [Nitrobacter sp. JJSN]|uniref:caspase family protein n=1 Tax=Nitrobacter sp. JJSN TaxID=3453033 RepID=UPI003F76E5B5
MTLSMFRSIVFGAIAAMVLTAHAAAAENRLALVIGQSAYRGVTPLPNPTNDAKAMTQMLGDAGFEVLTASDLSQTEMREKVGEFAAKVAAKGPDTVALIFYAGHGLQVDGENFLIPVDLDPKREADIPLQAVRLNDIMNTLTSVPSRMRIVLLDACRNNPFPAIDKTVGHGLAIVDAKVAAPGTFLSFSTSPGAEAEDGTGADSPYTAALLSVGREAGLSIEQAFKRVRLAVNKATNGRQTPWDSSSLTDGFEFFPDSAASARQPAESRTKRTVEEWRRELKGKTAEQANEIIVGDGSDEAYAAFVDLYPDTPFGLGARQWLDRHLRMVAWNRAIITNTAAGYRGFLAEYPDSDLTSTARKLEERLRNRPDNPNTAVAAAVAGPTCPCSAPPLPQKKKAEAPPKKQAKPDRSRYVDTPPRRNRQSDYDYVDDPPPPRSYVPLPMPSIGIIGGFGGRGVGFGSGGSGRGGMGNTPGRY